MTNNSQTPVTVQGEDAEDNATVFVASLNEDWFVRMGIGGQDAAYYSPEQARQLGFVLVRAADAALAAKRVVDLVMRYDPKTISHPGLTLQDLIDERGVSQSDLAKRMRRPKKTINEIIKGKCAITVETAHELEAALDVPASFWLQRQADFDAKARRAEVR